MPSQQEFVDFQISERERAIAQERQKVYGDPFENHSHIAQMIAPLLQPHSKEIAEGKALPPHVIALIMVQLKVSRMRNVFHQDNYDDLRVYLAFAEKWQKEHEEKLEVDLST